MAFKRYASPMILLGQMIRARRLAEFVNEFIQIHNKETEESVTWDVWLHRVFDMGYQEFVDKTSKKESTETLSDDVLKATVQESMGIINGFCPS